MAQIEHEQALGIFQRLRDLFQVVVTQIQCCQVFQMEQVHRNATVLDFVVAEVECAQALEFCKLTEQLFQFIVDNGQVFL